MPVTLDPDAAAVFKAFQEAGRPAYETLTAPEAREFYLAGRIVTNPGAAGIEIGGAARDPLAHRIDPGARLHAHETPAGQRSRAMPGILSRRRLGNRRP